MHIIRLFEAEYSQQFKATEFREGYIFSRNTYPSHDLIGHIREICLSRSFELISHFVTEIVLNIFFNQKYHAAKKFKESSFRFKCPIKNSLAKI